MTKLCQISTQSSLKLFSGISEHASTARPVGVLSLAASDFALDFYRKDSPQNEDWRKKAPVSATQSKTGIYNTSDKQGQTHQNEVLSAAEYLVKESIF
jgi:hypothetical protein